MRHKLYFYTREAGQPAWALYSTENFISESEARNRFRDAITHSFSDTQDLKIGWMKGNKVFGMFTIKALL